MLNLADDVTMIKNTARQQLQHWPHLLMCVSFLYEKSRPSKSKQYVLWHKYRWVYFATTSLKKGCGLIFEGEPYQIHYKKGCGLIFEGEPYNSLQKGVRAYIRGWAIPNSLQKGVRAYFRGWAIPNWLMFSKGGWGGEQGHDKKALENHCMYT